MGAHTAEEFIHVFFGLRVKQRGFWGVHAAREEFNMLGFELNRWFWSYPCGFFWS